MADWQVYTIRAVLRRMSIDVCVRVCLCVWWGMGVARRRGRINISVGFIGSLSLTCGIGCLGTLVDSWIAAR